MAAAGIWDSIKSGGRTLHTDRDTVAPLVFGDVQCLVCAGDQCLDVRGILICRRNTNTDRNSDLSIRDCEWIFRNGYSQSFCNRDCRIPLGFGHDDDQFLAAIASEQIHLPNGALAAFGKLLQNLVADWMPIVVIHILEVIDIQHYAAERTLCTLGARKLD